jgi:endogenous inhibitor of DNA gyrase (YacG/DUF329 family)
MQCPQCGKEIENPKQAWRPFCSERCKLIDLGKWISGQFRIAGEEQDESEGGSAALPNSPEEE